MTTITALSAFQDNYIWLIHHTHGMTCIDPGDASRVIEAVNQTQQPITEILITHHHADHLGGLHTLINAFPQCKIIGPHDVLLQKTYPTMRVETTFVINDVLFETLLTPGHTASHVCYHAPQQGWLFCGDTLFSAGCGRVFDGTMEALFTSIQTLKKLPNHTKVYCAHEYTRQNLAFATTIEPENIAIKNHLQTLSHNNICSLPTTIALEKKINPFFRTHTPALKTFAKQHQIDPSNEFEIFKALRIRKNNAG
jgi:hydroxyacylglutathione hydrolase